MSRRERIVRELELLEELDELDEDEGEEEQPGSGDYDFYVPRAPKGFYLGGSEALARLRDLSMPFRRRYE